MASMLDSGSNGPGLSPGQGLCVVLLDKSLYSYSASLRPSCMGTHEIMQESSLRWTNILSRGD